MLKNARKNKATYYFYNNLSNGDGTAEPQMDFGKPYNTIPLDSGEEKYVKLDTRFKGRIQRGNALGGTWAELQTQASNGGAHGDISLEQGCDGPATISSTCTDGKDCDTPVIGGFDWNVFVDANGKAAGDDVLWPAASVDGRKVLDTTMGNWDRTSPNQNTIRWLQGVLSQKYAYIEGGTGTDDIASANGCLAVTFYD
ncbi:hypothetical protein BJ878DRAFT_412919 [Calycina marina]|uniref:Uncharacterized protein n=1 Tax=Calycina marina TaxID=1763456 RepID=A0A9P7ZAU2_9HELO|nr:hypothetical protein BJ878DRAFT_412919 [Calycina marina]